MTDAFTLLHRPHSQKGRACGCHLLNLLFKFEAISTFLTVRCRWKGSMLKHHYLLVLFVCLNVGIENLDYMLLYHTMCYKLYRKTEQIGFCPGFYFFQPESLMIHLETQIFYRCLAFACIYSDLVCFRLWFRNTSYQMIYFLSSIVLVFICSTIRHLWFSYCILGKHQTFIPL